MRAVLLYLLVVVAYATIKESVSIDVETRSLIFYYKQTHKFF